MDELKALDRSSDPKPLLFLFDNPGDLALAAKGDGPAAHGFERQMQYKLDGGSNFPVRGHGEEESATAHILRMGE